MTKTDLQDIIPKLVITPPKEFGSYLSYKFSARTTLGALTQIILEANSRVLIASPFVSGNNFERVNPIKEAIYTIFKKNVNIDLISSENGIQIFEENWVPKECISQLRAFCPTPNLENENLLGSHAKILISDNISAYIGSANFTMPGLYSNLELGLLVKGDTVTQLNQFWDYLLNSLYLKRMI